MVVDSTHNILFECFEDHLHSLISKKSLFSLLNKVSLEEDLTLLQVEELKKDRAQVAATTKENKSVVICNLKVVIT
jgi:hypothetical protein